MNWSELKVAVADEVSVTSIPEPQRGVRVNWAIRRLERKHNFRCMQEQQTFTFTSGVASYSLPTIAPDFKLLPEYGKLRPVWINTSSSGRWFLRRMDYGRWLSASNTAADSSTINSSDYPHFYAIRGTQKLHVKPTPSADSNGEIFYIRYLPNLSDTNITNWFSQNAEDAIIYGAVAELLRMLQDDGRVQQYEALFERAFQEALMADSADDNLWERYPDTLPPLGFAINVGS